MRASVSVVVLVALVALASAYQGGYVDCTTVSGQDACNAVRGQCRWCEDTCMSLAHMTQKPMCMSIMMKDMLNLRYPLADTDVDCSQFADNNACSGNSACSWCLGPMMAPYCFNVDHASTLPADRFTCTNLGQ